MPIRKIKRKGFISKKLYKEPLRATGKTLRDNPGERKLYRKTRKHKKIITINLKKMRSTN